MKKKRRSKNKKVNEAVCRKWLFLHNRLAIIKKNNLKTRFIITIFLMLHLGLGFGQNDKYLTFELGGSGGLGSFNYESVFGQNEKIRYSFRTGFSFMPIDKNNGVALIFPQMLHGILGKKSHQMDFGIGLSPSFTTNFGGAYVRMPLSFSYRFEPEGKNHYWRIGYTPLISFLFDFQWEHWAGVTYAYKLKFKGNKK